jgi:hypothetical protein
MTEAIEIKEMQYIAIRLSFATAHCAIGVTMINGRVDRVTEKAVIVKLDTNTTVCFPKKALVKRYEKCVPGMGTTVFSQLAHWFKPDAYAANAIKKATHSGMIAA